MTGASSGIGRACALLLAAQGFHVFAGVRKERDGDALREAAAGQLTPLLVDVTDTASIAAARDTVARAVGEAGLVGLVNNAGVGMAGPLEYLPLAEARTAFEVNKAFRQQLEEHAPAFLEIVRKARPFGFGPSALCHTAWRKCLIPWAGLPVCDSSAVLLCTHAHVHMLCHAWMCHFHLHCAE